MDAHDLRIGDAEREQTMASLREHFAQGRLTHEELDERLDRALAARTARDLSTVTADLPSDGYGYRHDRPAEVAAWPSDYPPEAPDRAAWHAAMHAHRAQMRHIRREQRRLHHGRRRHGRGPGPLLPFLVLALVVGVAVGGWGVLKVLFFFWVGAMIFGLLHRKRHFHRSLR